MTQENTFEWGQSKYPLKPEVNNQPKSVYTFLMTGWKHIGYTQWLR